MHREDTYLAPTDLGHMWKLSLHSDVAWRWALTQEHVASGAAPVWPEPDRAPWKFEPPPFVNGGRLAFVICTFRHALLPLPISPKDVHIRVEDRWDQVTLGCVWMTEPGVEFRENRLVGQPLQLTSGRRVWLSAKTEPLPGGQREPLAVSSMLEPVTPGKQDVAAPAVFHRGVHLAA